MSDSILQVNLIKNKGGTATGITVDNSNANVTIGNLTATSLAGGTIASAVNFPAGHVLGVHAKQGSNNLKHGADNTTVWNDGTNNLTTTFNCVGANPTFLVTLTAGHSYNHSTTLYGASYFRLKCDKATTYCGSTVNADTYMDGPEFNRTNNDSGTFYLNHSSYTGSNHNDSGQKPTSVQYFLTTSSISAGTSFTFTPASFGNNQHGIMHPSITVLEIKS